jgi:hypothetical protein
MNHYRHQALGNILTSLWFGAKVYLSERSTTYEYLKRLGVVVFSIEADLHKKNPEALQSISDQEMQLNRKILMQEYGRTNLIAKSHSLVNYMLGQS